VPAVMGWAMAEQRALWTLLAALLPTTVWSVALSATRLRHGSIKTNVDYRLRLDNFNSVQYSAPITIGGQTLPVIYDTGSFEILVLSTLCRTCAYNNGVYDHSLSRSFSSASPAVTTEHLFGSGPVVSEKGFDTVHFGGPDSPYSASRMQFWQVLSHQIPVWDENAHFSGIVGLGHPTRIPEGFTAEGPPDETALASIGIQRFAICLERGRPDAPGWLIVSPSAQVLPQTSFMSSFKEVDVVGQVHWGVQMTNVHIPGLMLPDPCVPSCGAIIDSGTSLIAVPSSASGLVRALQLMIHRDCSNLHALPVLKIRLGNVDVELPPKAYVIKVARPVSDRNSSLWSQMFGAGERNECTAAFMTIDKDSQYGPVWILGMPFLRYYYTVFDRASKKIHVSRSTPSCQPSTMGSTVMVNATGGNFSGGGFAMSSFTTSDFEPTTADLNSARAPVWATEQGKIVL